MGVEREDTQLQPSLVCTEIRVWTPQPAHVPPSLSLSFFVQLQTVVTCPSLQTFVLPHMVQGKTGTIVARCQTH